MILDKNRRWFVMTDKQKSVLQSFTRYRSPIHEESYYKGIDIQYLKYLRKSLEECLDTDLVEVSIIYRTTVL